ncbi:hypothetical protein [Macellibacteroides fermentans]|uniref:hypothetical protein n=1 Tax=Macellibacteroides fermentans TaxID=879969 RepID=UPI00352D02E5
MQIFWIIILFFFIFLQFIFIKKNPAINRLFVLFLFVAFFMWYFVPILLTISGNTVVIDFLGVELTNYCSLAIKELTLYLLILFVFNATSIKKRIIISKVRFIENENLRHDKLFFNFTFIFMVAYIAFLGINQMDYTANNDISKQQGGIFQLLTFFSYYFMAYLWVLLIYGIQNNQRRIAVILIIAHIIVSVLSGSRILLLSLIYLILFLVSREENSIKKVRTYVILVVVSLASVMALPYMSAQRSGADVAVITKSENVWSLVLEELNVKLNSIAYSSVLLKYDHEEFAGFNPYLGSLAKFVPRLFWKDKPTATSFNEDISGIPSRRIPVLLDVNSESYNTGTSAYAVAAWQMGFITVLLTFFLNVLMFKLINNSLNNSSLYIKSFGFMLVGFPQLVMLPTYGDNILQKLIEAFVIFVLLIMLNIISLEHVNENSNF